MRTTTKEIKTALDIASLSMRWDEFFPFAELEDNCTLITPSFVA